MKGGRDKRDKSTGSTLTCAPLKTTLSFVPFVPLPLFPPVRAVLEQGAKGLLVPGPPGFVAADLENQPREDHRMTEDPIDRIVDEIGDYMSENPARLPESLAQTTTALALLDIAGSLRTIATALKSIDEDGVATL